MTALLRSLVLVALLSFPTGPAHAQAQPTKAAAQTKKKANACTAPKRFRIKKEIASTPVKDQGQTNTCWSFATTSFLESEAIRKGGANVDLSEMYFVRYAYLPKAIEYVRYNGRNTFWEGGQNHDVIEVLRREGALPEVSYTGQPQANGRHDHAELAAVLKGFLGMLVAQRHVSTQWTAALSGILDGYLGHPPARIEWQGKTMTGVEFRDQVLKVRPDDYVELTSFQHHPSYTQIALEVPDNWSHLRNYYNLPLDEFAATLDHALAQGYTVAWGGDTSEDTYNRPCGYALAQDESKAVTAQDRQIAFDRWDTTDDHSMHIIGTATDERGNPFFLVKDSYGPEAGPFGGKRFLSRNYVLHKTAYVLLHRDAIPAEIRKKLGF